MPVCVSYFCSQIFACDARARAHTHTQTHNTRNQNEKEHKLELLQFNTTAKMLYCNSGQHKMVVPWDSPLLKLPSQAYTSPLITHPSPPRHSSPSRGSLPSRDGLTSFSPSRSRQASSPAPLFRPPISHTHTPTSSSISVETTASRQKEVMRGHKREGKSQKQILSALASEWEGLRIRRMGRVIDGDSGGKNGSREDGVAGGRSAQEDGEENGVGRTHDLKLHG